MKSYQGHTYLYQILSCLYGNVCPEEELELVYFVQSNKCQQKVARRNLPN